MSRHLLFLPSLARSSTTKCRTAHPRIRLRHSSTSAPREPSRHALFYTELVAGMIPVALLGSAVYLGLRTWQQHLAHEKFLDEAEARIKELEESIVALRQRLKESGVETPGGVPTPSLQPGQTSRSRWWFW